jgi:arsenical pump membrane protein
MTSLTRLAWTERAGSDDRLLLVVDLRPLSGAALAAILVATPFLSAPLGRLSSPFALLVALPPLALALEAFGWRDRLATRLLRIRRPLVRLVTTYAAWLTTSAVLTLDVAAVAAASVGIAVGGDHPEERRWQLGGAILGANVGSLLLPFSNLTNLVLVSASGIGLAAYVGLAVGPQLAAALAVGILFAMRARRAVTRHDEAPDADARSPARIGTGASVPMMRAAGGVALAGAVGAVAIGAAGGDMAIPFATCAAVLAGTAVATSHLSLRTVVRGIPFMGLAVIAVAALANGQIDWAAGFLPRPDATVGGLLIALVVGSVLAAGVNNLPAAAFGAVWLARSHPASIIAFLIGTNVAALATPHGSVATILARAVGVRHGVDSPIRAYLGSAWRYALIGSLAAFACLVLVTYASGA